MEEFMVVLFTVLLYVLWVKEFEFLTFHQKVPPQSPKIKGKWNFHAKHILFFFKCLVNYC